MPPTRSTRSSPPASGFLPSTAHRTSSAAADKSSSPPSSDDTGSTRSNTSRRGPTSEELVTKSGRNKHQLPEDLTMSRILTFAQFIKRGVDMWVNIPQAMNVGLANELLELYKEMGEGDEGYDEGEKKTAEDVLKKCGKNKDVFIKAYEGILHLFDEFKGYIDDLDDEQKWLFWRKVNQQAEQGRNNDTAKIKLFGHTYVLETGEPNPPLGMNDDKSGRGVSHPQLLRMIVPMSVLYKHGNNDDFEEEVKAKRYAITHKSFPAFLFDLSEYDSEQPEDSLLRGHYPLRVCRSIFMTPSSALAKPGSKGKSTRPGNARIVGQKEITPEMIAYSCVQARFFISKLKVFGETDENFNIKTFYYSIINLFSNKDSDWAKGTLAWWNEQVFGDMTDGDEQDDEEEDDEDETSVTNLLSRVKLRKQVQSQTQPDPQYSQNAFATES